MFYFNTFLENVKRFVLGGDIMAWKVLKIVKITILT